MHALRRAGASAPLLLVDRPADIEGKLVEAEASGASITPTAVRFRQRARATGDQHHDMQNPAAAARWLKAAAQVDPEVEAPAKP